jgi:hypothetical protein
MPALDLLKAIKDHKGCTRLAAASDKSLPVACPWSVDLFGYSGFFHHQEVALNTCPTIFLSRRKFEDIKRQQESVNQTRTDNTIAIRKRTNNNLQRTT